MRAAQIYDLNGSYGTIEHEIIWNKVAHYAIDMLLVTLMVDRVVDGSLRKVDDKQAQAATTRDYVLKRGIQFGFVRVPEWTGADEATFASQLNADLNRYGLDGKTHPRSDPCFVMANAEAHTFDIVKFEDAWRGGTAKRPTRDTGLGIEGFQAGRFTQEQIDRVNADPYLTMIGEAYDNAMRPYAHDAVKDDLRNKFSRVKVYYDGLPGAPARMDGVLYTLERLP